MRLISWNIQWGKGRDGHVDLRRIAAVVHAADADVVCLQEVAVNHPALTGEEPAAGGGDQVAMLNGLLTGYQAVFATGSDLPDGVGGRRCFGNLLLSRLPVGEVVRHALPFPADPSVAGMQRVALEAVIETTAGPLRVITTHLEYYSLRQRVAQLEALARIVGEGRDHALQPRASEAEAPFAVMPRGVGCVLCGDLNCPPDAAELAPLLPVLVDAWRILNPSRPHPPTAGLAPSAFFPQPVSLDRAMVSADLAPRLRGLAVDALCEFSDHQPVVLDLV